MRKRDTEPLLPDSFYHVFARTNNQEILFATEENYRFFISRYSDFLWPIAKTYAFALLENHVHFLIKIRDKETLDSFCKTINQSRIKNNYFKERDAPFTPLSSDTVASYQFQRFFTSYAKAYNKQQNRYGNLIQRPFKRKAVADESHLFHLVYYIHNNPRKHGFTKDFRTYKWSSYQAILSSASTKIERAEVLDWFGGKAPFIAYHEQFMDDRDWEF